MLKNYGKLQLFIYELSFQTLFLRSRYQHIIKYGAEMKDRKHNLLQNVQKQRRRC